MGNNIKKLTSQYVYFIPGTLVILHTLLDEVFLSLNGLGVFDQLHDKKRLVTYPIFYILLILVGLKVSGIKISFRLLSLNKYFHAIGVLFLFMILGVIANKLIEAYLFEHWLLKTSEIIPKFEHLFLAVILAPVLEEIFYRGIFTRSLIENGGYSKAMVIFFGALFFGIIHNGSGIVFNFFTGIAFTMIYLKTKNLTVTIFAHGFQNLFYHLINY